MDKIWSFYRNLEIRKPNLVTLNGYKGQYDDVINDDSSFAWAIKIELSLNRDRAFQNREFRLDRISKCYKMTHEITGVK